MEFQTLLLETKLLCLEIYNKANYTKNISDNTVALINRKIEMPFFNPVLFYYISKLSTRIIHFRLHVVWKWANYPRSHCTTSQNTTNPTVMSVTSKILPHLLVNGPFIWWKFTIVFARIIDHLVLLIIINNIGSRKCLMPVWM